MDLNDFDKVIYINLPHRKDRQTELLAELDRLGVKGGKIHHLEAHFDPFNGHRGCALNHGRALDFALKSGFKNVLILEDDFVTTRTKKEISTILEHFFSQANNAWDVYLLGGSVRKFRPTEMDGVFRVFSSPYAHAYAVNGHYFKELAALCLRCYVEMQGIPFFHECVDQAFDRQWEKLMAQDRWYFTEIFAQQRRSYSDIDHRIRDQTIHQEKF